jgi:hypothetical protein
MKPTRNIFFLTVFSFIFILPSFAQFNRYGGKKKPQKMGAFIKPLNNTGWYFAPGVTTTPKLDFFEYEPTLSEAGLTASNLNHQARTGLYLEVGRFKLLSTKSILSYIDYGLAYKFLRSGQTYELPISNINFQQDFERHAALVHFNANNVLAMNKNFFFQNTLGVNVDYAFSQKLETTDVSRFTSTYQEEPTKLWAQLHYKFGLGFRVSNMWYMIPSVEIPIFNGWKWEDGRSTFGAFNSRYRPVIISVRFTWLTQPDCPKVWDNDSNTTNGGRL